jgi:hypothetical protein
MAVAALLIALTVLDLWRRRRRGRAERRGAIRITRASGRAKGNMACRSSGRRSTVRRAFLTTRIIRQAAQRRPSSQCQDLERVRRPGGQGRCTQCSHPALARIRHHVARRTVGSSHRPAERTLSGARPPARSRGRFGQKCGSLAVGERAIPTKTTDLRPCIAHGEGVTRDAMFPCVYNANLRLVQKPGFVRDQLRADSSTRASIRSTPPAQREPAPLVDPFVHGCARVATGTGRRSSSKPPI